MVEFKIPIGTRCKIQGPGEKEWREWVTAKELTFDRYRVDDNGGSWVFGKGDGWLLKVSPKFVIGRREKGKRVYREMDRGKGVSRRRSQRAVKAWKNR